MRIARTEETEEKYSEFRRSRKGDEPCRFCAEELPGEKFNFKLWKILHNNFPYDNIASLHDMVIPKRHFQNEADMTVEERDELTKIKTEILPATGEYDCVFENMEKMRSMSHYHIHLIRFKRR